MNCIRRLYSVRGNLPKSQKFWIRNGKELEAEGSQKAIQLVSRLMEPMSNTAFSRVSASNRTSHPFQASCSRYTDSARTTLTPHSFTGRRKDLVRSLASITDIPCFLC